MACTYSAELFLLVVFLDQAVLQAAYVDLCCFVDLPGPAVPFILPTLETESVRFYSPFHPIPFSSYRWTSSSASPVTGQQLCPNQDTSRGTSALRCLLSPQPEPADPSGQWERSWALPCSVLLTERVSPRCSVHQEYQFFEKKPKPNTSQKKPQPIHRRKGVELSFTIR